MIEQQETARVCLGLMCPGHVRVEMMTSYLNALALVDSSKVRFTGYLQRISGPYLDSGRNKLVQDFMADEQLGDWLLFVDDDIVFSPSDVETLFGFADDKHPVVSGVYVSPLEGHGRCPVAYRRNENMDHIPLNLSVVAQVDHPVPVDSAGAGFLALHRPFLQRMADLYGPPDPWFSEPIRFQRHHGEDLGFFMRCLEMGVQPWLHCGVKLGHIKTVMYTPFSDGGSA